MPASIALPYWRSVAAKVNLYEYGEVREQLKRLGTSEAVRLLNQLRPRIYGQMKSDPVYKKAIRERESSP